MAVDSSTVETYDDLLVREDLQEAYSMISPEECPVQQALGTRDVDQPRFDWPTLELASPVANNRVAEGEDDPGTDDPTLGLRWWNYTQISDKVVSVSNTSQSSDSAANNVQRIMTQISLKIRELKRDMELSLTANVAANAGAGDGATARVTAGLQAWLSTNVQDGGAGASDPVYSETTYGTVDTAAVAANAQAALDEDDFNALIESCWNAGANPSLVLCHGGNKRVISSTFVGNATRYQNAPDKEVVAAIDFYDSDFGMLTVVPTRFMPALDANADGSGGSSWSVLLLDPDYARIAFLDNVQRKPLAETGHSLKSLVWAEYGLQVDNEAAHGIYRDTNLQAA